MGELDINELVRAFHRKLAATPMDFFRYLYHKIDWRDTLIGIKGPKGCGKTTLILQHIKQAFPGNMLDKVLYISLDNLWFANHSVLDLVEYHYTHGGTHLFIDEIHYEPHWQILLKNISDDYPGLSIVYTGSSMLHIDAAAGDLSRRQVLYELRGLSFREFVEYEGVASLSPLQLDYLLSNHVAIATDIYAQFPALPLFYQYLRKGYYPFYKTIHQGLDMRLQSVVAQVIGNDYPQIDEVSTSTIRKAKKMLMVLSSRVPQQPNITQLCRELETDRNQGLKILNALSRGGLLQLLGDNAKSLNKLSRPDKIYINNPTLMYALSRDPEIGSIRETFFLNQLSHQHDVQYPKSGDFLVDGTHLFEVGGKGKTFDQIKDAPNSYLAVDDTEVGRGNRIPLWLFGMLY